MDIMSFFKKGRNKVRRNGSKSPLIKHINNNTQDEYDQAHNRYNSTLTQRTTLRGQLLQRNGDIPLSELAELLGGVPVPITDAFEDRCWVTIEPKSGQKVLDQNKVFLIWTSVSRNFPKPPPLDQELCQHLKQVKDVILHELVRLGQLLEPLGLAGCLINCYHRQTFDHLSVLLKDATSAKKTFELMYWAQHVYLSKDLLNHPEVQELDPLNKVDLVLFQEWQKKAEGKLLENVQTDVQRSLEKILQNEEAEENCDCEEAYVSLYVDTIQCISAMKKAAENISADLTPPVKDICFRELLRFMRSYSTEQIKVLEKKAEPDKLETIHFLKTLRTCRELKLFLETEGAGVQLLLLSEMKGKLEDMEEFTMNLLKDAVTHIAKSHLKKYFKSKDKRFMLCTAINEHFPKLEYLREEQTEVVDEIYKLVVGLYVRHLVQRSQKKLKINWSHNIKQTVAEDAEFLHSCMSDLAPGVQQWNFLLLQIREILNCDNIEGLKITSATIQDHCLTKRSQEDMELLPCLLRWKGLRSQEVVEVMDALPREHQPPAHAEHRLRCGPSWSRCVSCLPVG
ncbi:exocyst complex component 3 [Echeneis naucrates]|uniref:exocyst complex component 3 n=1 Tax=Echeneis naucrates TaxID=173247 RepID=UPI0011140EDE|nr:exocyst complex component 3-like [Echeneis naucrates]